MVVKTCVLFVFLLYIGQNCCKKAASDDDNFVATNEWQQVKKGQKVPTGLHIRINFHTGITEAKLPDEKTNKKNEITILKNLNDLNSLSPDELYKVKNKYRSYKELKKHLKDLNLTPKSDSDLIADLIKTFKQLMTNKKIDLTKALNILEDLDFLLHQYDNGVEFLNQNGFEQIIYSNLNSTSTIVKRDILRLLGSLLQNNGVTKLHALQTGCIGILLRLLSFESDGLLKSRSIVALGALLRGFPHAQLKFIENGGLDVVSKFFTSDDIKIQIKIVTLMSDLIEEMLSHDLDKVLIRQYSWCENLNKLLQRLLASDSNDHDSIEKCLTAMKTVKDKCGAKYKKHILKDLEKRYEALAIEDVDKSDEISKTTFFSVLKDICNEILHYVDVNHQKTEL